MSDKSWEPDLTLSLSQSLIILNNFCFHVYAQKSLSHSHTISLSQCLTLTLQLSHSLTLHMLNNFCFHVYAETSHSHSHILSFALSLDMLNNFCFHLYAQKSLFLAKIAMRFFGPQHHPILTVVQCYAKCNLSPQPRVFIFIKSVNYAQDDPLN